MQISTSILNSNNRIESIKKLNYTKTKYIHIDIMDGRFVNDKQFTINEIKELNNLSQKKLDIHLMVENPIEYIVGIAIKPNTDINTLLPYIEKIDLLLIMSVEPGKGGQQFIKETPSKIEKIKKAINNNIMIEVDGGINNNTIKEINNIDIAVVGSYIIKSNNYNNQINNLIKK